MTSILELIEKNKKRGFTLVEALVAISILVLVIIGPITVAQKGIQNAYYASDQVTAVFLAQEAAEALRIERDELALLAVEGDQTDIDTASWVPSNCLEQTCGYVSEDFVQCGSGNNRCAVKYNESNNEYGGDVGVQTPFTRTITVRPEDGGGRSVTVDVAWTAVQFGNSIPRHVTLDTWIYDHYKAYEP